MIGSFELNLSQINCGLCKSYNMELSLVTDTLFPSKLKKIRLYKSYKMKFSIVTDIFLQSKPKNLHCHCEAVMSTVNCNNMCCLKIKYLLVNNWFFESKEIVLPLNNIQMKKKNFTRSTLVQLSKEYSLSIVSWHQRHDVVHIVRYVTYCTL